MEAYKFETTVLENGTIQIPEIASFAHQRVEIFIVVKPTVKKESRKQRTIENFLAKWTRFIKGFDPDELKIRYLQEKCECYI